MHRKRHRAVFSWRSTSSRWSKPLSEKSSNPNPRARAHTAKPGRATVNFPRSYPCTGEGGGSRRRGEGSKGEGHDDWAKEAKSRWGQKRLGERRGPTLQNRKGVEPFIGPDRQPKAFPRPLWLVPASRTTNPGVAARSGRLVRCRLVRGRKDGRTCHSGGALGGRGATQAAVTFDEHKRCWLGLGVG
jgi:hypothetical protein